MLSIAVWMWSVLAHVYIIQHQDRQRVCIIAPIVSGQDEAYCEGGSRSWGLVILRSRSSETVEAVPPLQPVC